MVSENLTHYFCFFQIVMLDCDKVLKAPMSLSRLNSMNATLTLNAMNATLPLNAMNANLTLNANLNLNANLTLNATNASTIEHSSVNSKVVHLKLHQ